MKNMFLLKESTFFAKLLRNSVKMRYVHVSSEFRNDWVKIVDFLIKAYF